MVPHLCPSQPQACLSDHRKAPYWTPSSENIQGNAHSSRQKGFYLRACGARALASGRVILGGCFCQAQWQAPGVYVSGRRTSFSEDGKASGSRGSSSKVLRAYSSQVPWPTESPPVRTRWMAETKSAQPSSKQGREREKGGQQKQCAHGRRQGAAGPHLQAGCPRASSSVPHSWRVSLAGPAGLGSQGTPTQGSPLLRKRKNLNRGGKREKAGVFQPKRRSSQYTGKYGSPAERPQRGDRGVHKHPSGKSRVPAPRGTARRLLPEGYWEMAGL